MYVLGSFVNSSKTRTEVKVAAGSQIEWGKILNESYELAVQCVQTNYYVAKRMVERFIPVLESSDSPTIVNVSSSIGKLKVVAIPTCSS
ncbi:putative NAD(P)-binding domain superfamily [Helianthus anomalus]